MKMNKTKGAGLIPLLHKHSLLRTKPRLLQRDVIVQMSQFPSWEVSNELEAFVRISVRLHVSHQSLRGAERNDSTGQ